ncbi:glycosyltransferase 1 domain-containing protein 1 isoform X3 [Pristis pectinata]|uniref:glycosyltransferase 1 domain-containing protein 1 isoform X3 n=1 Tax=Pristis pectinata TaxID=685728 RepID=UPI00223E83D6|nr:glycosyltransferase 1 domain-containing protein 1 isoform X3 [Pristis pectinata]
MKLLFLASLSPCSGNRTTARRICEYIECSGHLCMLRDIGDFKSSSQVADLISEKKFDAVLIIHLYKAGRLLLDSSVPYGAIFGGTDINEDVKDAKKHEVMGTILQRARFLVAFTDQLKKTAEQHWPFAGSKIHVQSQVSKETRCYTASSDLCSTSILIGSLSHPQASGSNATGVVTKPCAKFNWGEFLQNSGIQFKSIDPYIFLLVCGLRQVKDPLYLVDAFSAWHKVEPCVYLVIIGPEIDPVFAQQVKAKLKSAHGVYLVSEKPQEELHAAMRDSFAVVNSSVSEGMSSTILEEFVELSKRLISDTGLKESIVTKAKEYVEKHHSKNSEKETYQKLTANLL